MALARIPVGVVVERRNASNPWIDVAWRPVGVLAGVPAAAPWTILESSDDRASFYAGLAEIALYRTETATIATISIPGAVIVGIAAADEIEPPFGSWPYG
jgi:hypothetical protein